MNCKFKKRTQRGQGDSVIKGRAIEVVLLQQGSKVSCFLLDSATALCMLNPKDIFLPNLLEILVRVAYVF